jgi:hypothetical protein
MKENEKNYKIGMIRLLIPLNRNFIYFANEVTAFPQRYKFALLPT